MSADWWHCVAHTEDSPQESVEVLASHAQGAAIGWAEYHQIPPGEVHEVDVYDPDGGGDYRMQVESSVRYSATIRRPLP